MVINEELLDNVGPQYFVLSLAGKQLIYFKVVCMVLPFVTRALLITHQRCSIAEQC